MHFIRIIGEEIKTLIMQVRSLNKHFFLTNILNHLLPEFFFFVFFRDIA